MAPEFRDSTEDFITTNRVFTLSEAVRHMKEKDKLPTNEIPRWRSVKTGEAVTIGYS